MKLSLFVQILLSLLASEFTNQRCVPLLPDKTCLMTNLFCLCKRDTWLALWPSLKKYRAENILVAVHVIKLLGWWLYEHLSPLVIQLIQILTFREQSLYILLFLSFFFVLNSLQSHDLNCGLWSIKIIIWVEIREVIRRRATFIKRVIVLLCFWFFSNI